jgi:hypothetical protein
MILIPTSCDFFSGSPSPKNSKVKRAWPRAMGDRPGSSFRVRTSEDKMRRKDLCWSVRTVYVLEKRSDVSGPGLEEVGRYRPPPSYMSPAGYNTSCLIFMVSSSLGYRV